MVTKKKPEPPNSQRVVNTWHAHPVMTLGTAAAAVAVLAGIAPLLIWALHYYATHEELESHKAAEARVIAWATVQAIKNETLSLRNRVNDCDIQKDKAKAMTALERAACAQYQQEYDDATRRFNEARRSAGELSKEK